MLSTVLAIEPDKAVRKQIQKALAGTQVVFASADNAIREAKRQAPAVILLGKDLPARDEVMLSRGLRIDEDTRDIPVLLADPNFGTLRHRVETQATEHSLFKSFRREIVPILLSARSVGTSGMPRGEGDLLASGGFPVDEVVDMAPFAGRATRYQAILATALTTQAAAKILKVNPSRIRQRLLANPPDLYATRQGGAWCLPTFQFDGNGLVPNIEKVIPCLGKGLDVVAVDGWFRREHLDLEDGGKSFSPLEWLSQGRPYEPVAELAKDL